MSKTFWVYILTNEPEGTLYVGVTSDISRRLEEHRLGIGSTFTTKYNLNQLVYAERHDYWENAIKREKILKKWNRKLKMELIEKTNPDWLPLNPNM